MVLFKGTRRVADRFEADLSILCATGQGVPLRFTGVAGYTAVSRRNEQVQTRLAWYLEAIVRGLTVEELVTDVKQLTDSLIAAAGPELARDGLHIVSVRLHKVEDPTGYLRVLAAPQMESIRRAARDATALAHQQAAESEAERTKRHADAIRAAEAQRRGAPGDRPGPQPPSEPDQEQDHTSPH